MYIDGLVQDCSNSSALAMESLQSCTNPLIYASPGLNHLTHYNLVTLYVVRSWNIDTVCLFLFFFAMFLWSIYLLHHWSTLMAYCPLSTKSSSDPMMIYATLNTWLLRWLNKQHMCILILTLEFKLCNWCYTNIITAIILTIYNIMNMYLKKILLLKWQVTFFAWQQVSSLQGDEVLIH